MLWAGIALLTLWVLVALVMEVSAWHAVRLGRREAPASFRAPPRRGSHAKRASLAFLGDMQRGVADVALPLAGALRREPADLLASVGDFAAHAEAPYLGTAFDAFEAAGVDTPTRVAPGNHDLYPRGVRETEAGYDLFRKAYGPTYWSERVGPVLVVGLDNALAPVTGEQLRWLRSVVEAHDDGPWIAVCHRPPRRVLEEDAVVDPGQDELVALLEAHPPAIVVAGNEHEYADREVNGVPYVINAHGGDVHGLGLTRGRWELLRVEAEEDGTVLRRVEKYGRRVWPRVYANQLAVRCWWSRRTPVGAVLSAPVGLPLAAVGRRAPLRGLSGS